ncbi:MAG TPA: c-type cytochrome [Candidatus Binataceae bacterium]|nr:c-type cytochrome [Candidatus Binataceae bacterium]
MKAIASRLLILAVSVLLIGLSTLSAYADDDIPVATTYQIYCARCHGDTGQGDGPDGATLSPKPRDFADCAIMSKISDATIIKAITSGGASVGLSRDMPAWGEALSDKKIHALAAHVRTFCHK